MWQPYQFPERTEKVKMSPTPVIHPGRLALIAASVALFAASGSATAQITTPQGRTLIADRTTTLRDQLINRLRATSEEQREYLAMVVEKVEKGELELKLVIAVERYAMRRKPAFPFPFFERALRYEAHKQGVALPSYHHFLSTASPVSRRR